MKLLRFKRPKKTTASSRFLREVNVQQEVLALQIQFKELLKVLRENAQEALPWYIVLGPEEVGKTSWLMHPSYQWHAVIPSVFAMHSPKMADASTKLIHPICARIGTEGVFIEIPGRYLEGKSQKNGVWEVFLKLLKKNKVHTRVHGAVLMLALDHLSQWSAQKHQEQIYLFKYHLHLLAQTAKHPIHLQILFNKMDTVAGFAEFFSESLQEERSNVFGIEFPGYTLGAVIPASHIFSEQFALLLVKLNERVIALLHHERLMHKKVLISDFPQQFASFKTLINRYIYDLVDIAPYQNKMRLKSIYFFSHLNCGQTEDQLAKLLSIYQLPERVKQAANPRQKSYFGAQLLHKIAQSREVFRDSSKGFLAISRQTGLTLTALFTLTVFAYLGVNFYQKTQQLNQLQKDFSSIGQQNFTDDSAQSLFVQAQSLAYLRHITTLLHDMPFSGLMTFSWHPLHELQVQATQNYEQILQRQFVPALTRALTNDLLSASTADLNSIYPTLKAYLALKNPKKNNIYLTQWLQTYLLEQKNKYASSLKLDASGVDFKLWPPVKIDNSAVLHAQSILGYLPKPFLAYVILKGESAQVTHPFPQGFDKVFVYPEKLEAISAIYTREKIVDVYFEQIPSAVHAAFFGNSVIGRQWSSEKDDIAGRDSIEKVRAFYLTDYAKRWQQILIVPEIKLVHDYAQVLTVLEVLSQKPSVFSLFLKKVTDQISLNATALTARRSLSQQKQFYADMNRYFQIDPGTSQMFNAKAQVVDVAVRSELMKIKKVLERVSAFSDVKKASFDVAKTEYENQALFGKLAKTAFEVPPPLSRWLVSLISNDWLIILQNAHAHITKAWQTTVLPEYRSKLKEHYPFAVHSMNDVELADFAHFLGKAGTLDIFFNHYLQSFIDATSARWQWRELYGQSVGHEQDFPLQLERATLLRKMFFSKTGELNVEFYLIPGGMSPTLRDVQLNIDGQVVNSLHLSTVPLIWPGIKNRDGSSLVFFKKNGEQQMFSERGCWSFFRLLNSAYVQPEQNIRQFLLTFDLNGNAVRYQLAAENLLNPFIPNFISQFDCPEKF